MGPSGRIRKQERVSKLQKYATTTDFGSFADSLTRGVRTMKNGGFSVIAVFPARESECLINVEVVRLPRGVLRYPSVFLSH